MKQYYDKRYECPVNCGRHPHQHRYGVTTETLG